MVAARSGVRRERVRVYRFDLRLIEVGSLWSEDAVRTFKASQIEATRRLSPSGFRRYQAEMERNGFELQRVRVVRDGAAA